MFLTKILIPLSQHQEQESEKDDRTNRAYRMPRWSRYDAVVLLLTSKQDPIMSTNNSLQEFAARFAAASTQSLIAVFNRQVGSNAWTSARALYDQALIAELQGRGINLSAVYDGRSIDFSRPVRLDETANSLVQE